MECCKVSQKYIAEFIGTYMLIFFGCGSIMIAERFPGSVSPEAIALIFGVVVATVIYTIGHVSGAHLNPAVTLAFAVIQHFPPKQILYYWTAQCGGSILAMATLYMLLPDGNLYGATLPNIGLAPSFMCEIVLTFFLMFVITAVATDTRAEGMMAGVAIGSIVALCSFVGGPLTGSSMNPARSLGPALLDGSLGVFWIYLFAPFIGAVLGALTYQKIRCETVPSNVDGCC